MRRAHCVYPKCGAPTDGQGYRRFVCDAHWHTLPPQEQASLLAMVRDHEARDASERAYREAADNPTFTYAVDRQCFLIEGASVSLAGVKYAAQNHNAHGYPLQVEDRVFSRVGLLKMLEFADSVSGYHPRT